MRKVADALLDPKLSHMMLPAGVGHDGAGDSTNHGSVRGDATGDGELAVSASPVAVNTTPALSARQQAALLYALAGDQGDSESLLQLGWMLYYGEQGTHLHYFTLLQCYVPWATPFFGSAGTFASILRILIFSSMLIFNRRCSAKPDRCERTVRDCAGA